MTRHTHRNATKETAASARAALHAAGRGGARAALAYERKTSDAYGVCRPDDGSECGLVLPLSEAKAHARQKGHAITPLWVQQRPLKWVEESEIVAREATPNGRINPGGATALIAAATVRDSNFDLTEEYVRDLADPQLGWHLYALLGTRDLLQRLTGADPNPPGVTRKKS